MFVDPTSTVWEALQGSGQHTTSQTIWLIIYCDLLQRRIWYVTNVSTWNFQLNEGKNSYRWIERIKLLFELTYYLVHLKKNFLLHFCDSVAVVGKRFFIHLLLSDGISSAHTINNQLFTEWCSLLSHPKVTDRPKNISLIDYVGYHIAIANHTDVLLRDGYHTRAAEECVSRRGHNLLLNR